MAQFYQIQNIDELKQIYADVQVVHVESEDVAVSNHSRPQQLLLQDDSILLNETGQQVVYQTTTPNQQYQQQSTTSHFIIGDEQQPQSQQVMLQHQSIEHHQVSQQSPMQTQQIYQTDGSQQSQVQQLQQEQHQLQHVPTHQQQVYYTTSEQLLQQSPILQQQQQEMQQQQQQQLQHVHSTQQQQHYQTQQQQIVHQQQHSMQNTTSQHQQVQVQQSAPQQIVYRMQTQQQQPQQMHQSTQVMNNTHVIVQQPNGQVLIHPQQMQTQRILYNTNRMYNSPQSSPSNQIHTILQQSQQQQHIQLQTHARLLHRSPSQSQTQQTQQATPQQAQQTQHHLQQNVVFHQIQPVQKSAMSQPPQQQQQQQTQQNQVQMQHTPTQGALLNATLGVRASIRVKAPRGAVNSAGSAMRVPTSSVRLPLRHSAPTVQQPTQAAARNPRVRNPGVGSRARGGGRGGRGAAATRIAPMSSATAETGIQTASASVQTQSGVSHATASPMKTVPISAAKQYYRLEAPTGSTPQPNLPLYQSTPRTGGALSKQRLLASTSNSSTQISSTSTSSTASATFEGDLEDSIEAVIVKKEQQKPVAMVATATGTTLTTYYTKDEDDNRFVHTNNGHAMTLTEFKKRNPTLNPTTNNMRNYVRPNNPSPTNPPALPKATTTTINSMSASGLLSAQRGSLQKIVRPLPVARATPPPNPQPPVSSAVHQTSHNNYEIQTQHVLQNRSGHNLAEKDRNSAKMLVILVSGEQRLITFTLPRESCTVQDLLEQVSVPFDSTTTIQCVENPGANIDFVVTVGFSVQESASELISRAEASLQMTTRQETPSGVPTMPLANSSSTASAATGTMYSNASASSSGTATTGSDETASSNTFSASTSTSNAPAAANKAADEPPRKVIQGYYAICQSCGFSGYDHAKCERCKRIFLEPPKRVPCVKISTTAMESHGSKTPSDAAERKRGCEIAARIGAKTGTTYHSVGGPTGSRGRGGPQRGRTPRSGRKHAEAETVILTLSSDEELDEDTTSKSSTNMGATEPNSNAPSPTPNKPFSFEPFLIDKEEEEIYGDFIRGDVLDTSKCIEKRVILLPLKTIRIAAYRFDTTEKVAFTSNGLCIEAPIFNAPKETCRLQIHRMEVVKIIAHFSQSDPSIMAVYVLRRCAQYIKESLKIPDCDKDAPYYSPNGPFQMRKLILEIDGGITKEAREGIMCLWDNLDEISQDEVQELLARSIKAEKRAAELNETTIQLSPGDVRQLLIYPSGKGGISIGTEDYLCLAADQYLNDIIIDFYLKWVHDNIVPQALRGKTHIFSTFFYKRLTTLIRSSQQLTDKDVKPTAAQKRHARVANWTKNVNIFEKDFIIIPINEQSHWFLAIICFPKLKGPVTYDTCTPVDIKQIRKQRSKKISVQIGSTTITPVTKRETNSSALAEACALAEEDSERDEAEGDDSDLASEDSEADNATAGTSTESPQSAASATPPNVSTSFEDDNKPIRIKQPMILIFDSLAGASRSRVVATLRDYLTCEYKLKMPEAPAHTFNKDNMPGHCVKVPQQNNFTDCGLYLLQYVENFFLDPIRDYKVPIKQLNEWFDTLTVTRKREDISLLLQRLMDEKNGKNKVLLPEIPFPTLNGELVEPPEGYNIEFEPEDDMDEEGLEEEEDVSGDIEMNSSTEEASEKMELQIAVPTSAVVPTQGRKIVVKRRMQAVDDDGEPSRISLPRSVAKSRRIDD